jgi:hypothetical protein
VERRDRSLGGSRTCSVPFGLGIYDVAKIDKLPISLTLLNSSPTLGSMFIKPHFSHFLSLYVCILIFHIGMARRVMPQGIAHTLIYIAY